MGMGAESKRVGTGVGVEKVGWCHMRMFTKRASDPGIVSQLRHVSLEASIFKATQLNHVCSPRVASNVRYADQAHQL
jgi:hypothetical protein